MFRVLCVLLFASSLAAQEAVPPAPPDIPDWAKSGCWNSRYEVRETTATSLPGVAVDAHVCFEGSQGTYTLRGYEGKLSNIKYTKSYAHVVGPSTPAIYGDWQIGIAKGYCVFRKPEDGIINGYWGYYLADGRRGPIIGSWDAKPVPPDKK